MHDFIANVSHGNELLSKRLSMQTQLQTFPVASVLKESHALSKGQVSHVRNRTTGVLEVLGRSQL